jgi:hypothetical protein
VRWRALTPSEVEAYDVLPRELASRVRVVRVPALPRRHAGMALGRVVLVSGGVPPDQLSPLLAHELVHVRQWAELGVAGFAVRYLADFGRGLRRHRRWAPAYRSIALEEAARAEAARWCGRVGIGRGSPGGPSAGEGGEAVP